MAYNLNQRFAGPPKYFAFYDPGTYQYEKPRLEHNKAPFLSTTPRKYGPDIRLWTQTIYDGTIPSKIQNISSLKSTQKRFPYEAFSEEDLKEILCRCGINTPCECIVSENEPIEEEVCQAKVERRIFKGLCLRSILGDESLSADGSRKRRRKEIKDESPPFYDARVYESTAFYQGCKWGRRTSKRTQKSLEERPGPADYYLEREPTQDEICAEKVRAYKRKTSRQLRFIEMVQNQNILEGRPGPATYNPTLPKGTDLQYIGSKVDRFLSAKYVVHPGPADHFIRRDFDPIDYPEITCLARLPEPAGFGIKAKRFVPQQEEGASPATYNINFKPCQFVRCPTTPFGSSAPRFKTDIIEGSDDEDLQVGLATETTVACPTPTWTFKSKTIHNKPLVKIMDEPSPADLPQPKYKMERSPESQYAAPFFSSEGRFDEWHNWMPVYGKTNNLEPIFCNLEKPKCLPAFNHGPLYRAKRFPEKKNISPAPNAYTVPDEMKSVLKTFNKRLADNIKNQHTFTWKRPIEPESLNYEQKEMLLIQKCIDLLEPHETFEQKTIKRLSKIKRKKPVTAGVADVARDEQAKEDKNKVGKPKLLRNFLYAHEMPVFF